MVRALRRPDGSILSLRAPDDPVFALDFLDEEVRAYLDGRLRAKRMALGASEEDERERAELERWQRARLLDRLAAQRWRR